MSLLYRITVNIFSNRDLDSAGSLNKMYLLPIELYQFLIIIIPLGLCFLKWKYAIRFVIAVFICSILSWLYFNLWAALDPPRNGLTNLVYLLSGWFWMLPVFCIVSILFYCSERYLSEQKRQRIGLWGFRICSAVTVIILGWSFFGRMSERRASVEARRQLERRDLKPQGREILDYVKGYWIVRYPDTEFGEIRLGRNGEMLSIGYY